MSLFFAHSGHKMSSLSVMNPLPTMDVLQEEQRKQSLCQWRPSNEMKRVPPIPEKNQEGAEEEGGSNMQKGGLSSINFVYDSQKAGSCSLGVN